MADGSDAQISEHAGDDGSWGSGIEVVAEPIRYPRSPLIALAIVALLPAIGLFLLHRWADSEADRYEADRFGSDLLDTSLDGAVAIGEQAPDDDETAGTVGTEGATDGAADGRAPTLTTELFDFRRTPNAVASRANADALRLAVDPVLAFIGDRSCAAVSVDGIDVTSVNVDLPVIPASNQKLLVATAALQILGPDYTFTTSVLAPPPVDGEVDGDVYLVGGGDPLLTSDDFPRDDPRISVASPTSFDVLADAFVDAGVQRIRGAVVGDGQRYDDEFTIDEWADGVAFVEAGPYDALLANDALVLGRDGRQNEPNAAAAREFVRLLNDRGIQVDNGSDAGAASPEVPVLASVQSAPMSAVVDEMLLESDNNTAEMLLKELGVATTGQGTRAAGLNALIQALDALGIPTDGIRPVDGSGLSSGNQLTCRVLLRVVEAARRGPIDAALPVAGRSGTLAGEFAGSPMEGRLRAKTGTLNNEPFDADPPAVKALSGYVDPLDDSGAGTIVFTLVLNGPDLSLPDVYQPLWDVVGERLASYPGGPRPDSLGPR